MTSSNASSTGSKRSLLRKLLQEQAARQPDDPHAWHMAYRMIRGEIPGRIPAIAAIMQDRHPMVVVQKSAQAGVSEALTSVALWAVDTMYARRGHVLYVMPTVAQMDDFTQSRIDAAIQDSAYLRGRLQPEPPARKGADSKRLKRIGTGYFYMRGAESKRQLTSIDADIVILDEYDFMASDVIAWADSRLASSRQGQMMIASTPSYPEAGINGLFLRSDQRRYLLTCRACSLEQRLEWPDNIDVDRAQVVCRECRQPMDVSLPGRWVASAPGNGRIHGYHLNRLYSPWANIPKLIEASDSFTAQEEQQFFNLDLGEVHVMPGGGVTMDDLDRCRGDYRLDEYAGQTCVMGVDVGKRLHVVIRERTAEVQDGARTGRLWFADAVESFEQLSTLAERFNVEATVIDAQPETRMSRDYQASHEGVWLARYHPGAQTEWERTGVVHLDRTEALDECFARIRAGVTPLPTEARHVGGGRVREGVGEYYREVMAPQRTLVPDATGNLTARWNEGSRDDHYAHAEVYCMTAGKRNLYDDVWEDDLDPDDYEPPVFKGIFEMVF